MVEVQATWTSTREMAALRKRLGNAGVDLSSPKLNESFVLVGLLLFERDVNLTLMCRLERLSHL